MNHLFLVCIKTTDDPNAICFAVTEHLKTKGFEIVFTRPAKVDEFIEQKEYTPLSPFKHDD